MTVNINKYQQYEIIKEKFQINGISVDKYKEINYGIQFGAVFNNSTYLIRIYESKKGMKLDFSQVKNIEVLNLFQAILGLETEHSTEKRVNESAVNNSDKDELELIGTDESGKGDFFGPLVIAGVYADANTKKILREIGADDSKKLQDSRIAKIAEDIKKLCTYSIVVIGNERYNELYEKFNNLNKLLAWGHARVIENILSEKPCRYALSDQFGSPDLILNALQSKGQNINLEQRPRAEENVVVAAASILARNEYVMRMNKLSQEFNIEFPKGASVKTIEIGRRFVKEYGNDKVKYVAKLHFSTAQKLMI